MRQSEWNRWHTMFVVGTVAVWSGIVMAIVTGGIGICDASPASVLVVFGALSVVWASRKMP
jgi:hypothetical protein